MHKYTGTFKKRDGTLRTMHFISEVDANGTNANTTQISDHTQSHPFGHANENGMVLVYDVEVDGFRYFNTKTQVGGVVTEVGWDSDEDAGSTRN